MKTPDSDGFTQKFSESLKRKKSSVLQDFFQKRKKKKEEISF